MPALPFNRIKSPQACQDTHTIFPLPWRSSLVLSFASQWHKHSEIQSITPVLTPPPPHTPTRRLKRCLGRLISSLSDQRRLKLFQINPRLQRVGLSPFKQLLILTHFFKNGGKEEINLCAVPPWQDINPVRVHSLFAQIIPSSSTTHSGRRCAKQGN